MDDKTDNTPLLTVLHLLQKYNLKGTEEILRREANIGDANLSNAEVQDADLSSLMQKLVDDVPFSYDLAYESLRKMIIDAMDTYKYELSMLQYPILVHLYISLISSGSVEDAQRLLRKYGPEQEEFFQDDLKRLAYVTKPEHIQENEIAHAFMTSKFVVQLSRDATHIFKRFLNTQKSPVLSSIVPVHLNIVEYDGSTRPPMQVHAAAGALGGEPTKTDNKTKVYYGLFKEPDYQSLKMDNEEEEELDEGGGDKPKKKKVKKDPLFSKKSKTDPNAPPGDRIPMPELKEVEKMEKARAIRESTKRAALGADSPPSVCFYTLMNTTNATSLDICDDSSLLAVGFANSLVKVWSLTPNKLRGMKSAEKLADIDKEASDVLVRMMEEKDRDSVKTLFGHSGPVYGLSFDPFKQLLLSCSEDSTIRLWSLMVWSCVVVYRGHVWACWDVKWSPHSHYFVSGGHDKVARVWATDSHQPLRMLAGHLSDVQCVGFHPNSNYVVTGSSDRTIRLWDVLNGNTVRVFTGHKSWVLSVCISPCGRYIASGGKEGARLWDIPNASIVACLPHTNVYALSFSRDNTLLATGSLECSLRLWDLNAMTESAMKEGPQYDDKDEKYLVKHFATKNASILHLHFTRRNLLLGVGPFDGSS